MNALSFHRFGFWSTIALPGLTCGVLRAQWVAAGLVSMWCEELVVWGGPATKWIGAPTVARALRRLSNGRGARKRTKVHTAPQPLELQMQNLDGNTAN